MTNHDAWDDFTRLSEAEKEAVYQSVHRIRMGPRAKVHRYSAEEWSIIEELDKATQRGKRPSVAAVAALRDYLPGGLNYRGEGQ